MQGGNVRLGNSAYAGTNPENSRVTSHIRLCDTFEGTDWSSDTLLGPGLMKAPVALVVRREGEHGGGGTTNGEPGAMAADLDLCGNPGSNLRRIVDTILGTPVRGIQLRQHGIDTFFGMLKTSRVGILQQLLRRLFSLRLLLEYPERILLESVVPDFLCLVPPK
jgi:hypothetical protein